MTFAKLISQTAPRRLLMVMCCALLVTLTACIAPRDKNPVLSCTSNAHCPADGKHFCDLTKKQCTLCTGNCPTANASSGSQGTDASSETTTGTVTTEDATSTAQDASTDSATIVTCEQLCKSTKPKPGSNPECYCDSSCVNFGDCCDDQKKYCEDSSDPSKDAGSSSVDASDDATKTSK